VAKVIALYVLGDPSWAVNVGVLAGGAVALLLNDNTQAAADASTLAVDTVTAVANHTLQVKIPELLREGLKFLSDLNPAAKPASDPAQGTGGGGTGAIAAALGCFVLMGILGLSACSTAQQQLACKVDQSVVPVGDAIIAGIVPAADPAVTLDQQLVHPAVVAYCASLGGTPVATTTGSAPIVPATPAAVLPVPPTPPALSVTPIPTPAPTAAPTATN